MDIIGSRTLRSVLGYYARVQPSRTFLIFEGGDGQVRPFTYAQFNERVNRLADALLALGVGRGDKVNLHLPNSPEFLLTWFVCAKIGAVMVPTDPRATAAEMAYILQHSESRVVVTTVEGAETIRATDVPVNHLLTTDWVREVTASDAKATGDECRAPSVETATTSIAPSLVTGHSSLEVQPSDEVAMLYTSGTTAQPKGVLITHANCLYAGEAMAKATRLGPEDRHLVTLPLFHAAAQCHAVMPTLAVGGSLALTERFSASRFFEQAIRYDATAAALFAAPVRMILAQPYQPEWRRNQLRFVTYAQNVTQAQWDEWHERFRAPLLQLWGMTETVGLPLMNPLHGERKPMAMGKPVLGYECRVVDDNSNEVPPHAVGQLVVRGAPGRTVMKGYFKNPGATAEALKPAGGGEVWLNSGDLAYTDEDGYFYFVDRAKDLIKRAGENVSASEVEAALKQHPAVFDAAVVGVPDEMRDERVKAFVILREGASASAEGLGAWCRERLSKYKVPELIEFRAELPRTSVGKVQKHVLRREGSGGTATRSATTG